MATCEFHSLHTWPLFWEIQLSHSLYHSVLSTIHLELDSTHITHYISNKFAFIPNDLAPNWLWTKQFEIWWLLGQDQNRNTWPLKSNVTKELVNQESEKESEEDASGTDDGESSG